MLIWLTLAACSTADSPADSQDSAATHSVALTLSQNPNSTLAALAQVELDEPAELTLEFWSEQVGPLRLKWREAESSQSLDLVGMRAQSEYSVRAVALFSDGSQAQSETLQWSTGALPGDLPPFKVEGDPAGRGITIVGPGVLEKGDGPGMDEGPWLFGVDGEGEVVWYYEAPEGQDIDAIRTDHFAELLPDGDLLLVLTPTVRVLGPGGQVRTNLSTEQQVSAHHDAVRLSDGSFLYLSEERWEQDVPGFDEPMPLIGDAVVHVDAQGVELARWSARENLDTTRFPDGLSSTPRPDSGELPWTHANSLWVGQDKVLISLRHQSQVVALDLETLQTLWLFGREGDFELASGDWFSAQHSVMMEGDTLYVYDNNNLGQPANSRVLAYTLDSDTATEVWRWEVGMYTRNLGEVDVLPNGNRLICAGGMRFPQYAEITELGPQNEILWRLSVGEDRMVYRAERVDWVVDSDLTEL